MGKDTIVSILVAFLHCVSAQDNTCNYQQEVTPGNTYHVYSPNYPNNYPPGIECLWRTKCPNGYNCRIDCNDIDIPQTPSCSQDRLLVSKSGDPTLTDADKYCGRGTLTAVSYYQDLSIGLIASPSSRGGRFYCQLTAQRAQKTPEACVCGRHRVDRILGGTETGVNEYPMMAGLTDRNGIFCGGVIIHKRYVLTAGHCVEKIQNTAALLVTVGAHNRYSGAYPRQDLQVEGILIHPYYHNGDYTDYDAALVRTASDIQFSDRVGQACLPFKFYDYSFAGSDVTALGWGMLFAGGPTSDVLMKVNLRVIDQNTCKNVSHVTDRQLCTYSRGKDACQGDSGGPLLYTDPYSGLLYSAAIISDGELCGNIAPGVNTRVTSILDWIYYSTPDANYCIPD